MLKTTFPSSVHIVKATLLKYSAREIAGCNGTSSQAIYQLLIIRSSKFLSSQKDLKGAKRNPKGAKWIPRSTMNPNDLKGAQRGPNEPKGAPRSPGGSQKGPRWNTRGAKKK